MILLDVVNDFFDFIGEVVLAVGVLCAALFGGLSNNKKQ